MKFNYASEKRKFETMWERLRIEYREAGMSEENIQKMYEYDWDMFKKERVFCMHNQFMPDGVFENDEPKDEGQNPLLHKFKEQMSTEDVYFADEKNHWISQINNQDLLKGLEMLSVEQLELLERGVIMEESLEQILKETGLGYYAIANRLSRIKRKVKKNASKTF